MTDAKGLTPAEAQEYAYSILGHLDGLDNLISAILDYSTDVRAQDKKLIATYFYAVAIDIAVRVRIVTLYQYDGSVPEYVGKQLDDSLAEKFHAATKVVDEGVEK